MASLPHLENFQNASKKDCKNSTPLSLQKSHVRPLSGKRLFFDFLIFCSSPGLGQPFEDLQPPKQQGLDSQTTPAETSSRASTFFAPLNTLHCRT